MNQDLPHSFIQEILAPEFDAAGLRVVVYRLDLAQPHYSGNKYYKLKGLAALLAATAHDTVVSFGGRWSNHLLALSQYGKDHQLDTVGLVRDVSGEGATPLLSQCEQNGMRMYYLDTASYRHRAVDDAGLQRQLCYGSEAYMLSEGGNSGLAISGCELIAQELSLALDGFAYGVVPVGTGATMAAIVRGCVINSCAWRSSHQKIGGPDAAS